jgi:hypothetical protein
MKREKNLGSGRHGPGVLRVSFLDKRGLGKCKSKKAKGLPRRTALLGKAGAYFLASSME